ncbi:MAG: hypothetical protein Q8O13_09880 [Candidatus Omnitrophota bacterium]|nr:hypothetical protein [Candidatus Omnitrophota bacterium]
MSFDRKFFESFDVLVNHYAQRENCPAPVVEFLLFDTAKFEVKHIVAVGEGWVAFTIYDKTGCSTDVVVPFEQIARIVLYRDPQKSEAIGFRL